MSHIHIAAYMITVWFFKMEVSVVLIIVSAFVCGVHTVSGAVATPLCDDIDSEACRLIHVKRPNLCTDNNSTLAMTTCRRFCGLCPIECYHCSHSVTNYSDCNTTRLCAVGEMCMIKQLHATEDGHDEFAMSCEPKAACDGTGLTIPFGKREIHPRDLSVHCCMDDLCNYPAPVTTPPSSTGCVKDIFFMVDEYSSQNSFLGSIRDHMLANAMTLMTKIVQDITIGPNNAYVGLTTYSHSAHKQFQVDKWDTNQDVINAIKQVQVHGRHHGTDDIDEALAYLLYDAMTTDKGDRPNVPDVVVMITDRASVQDVHALVHSRQLKQISHDIITIEVGRQASSSTNGQLATDAAHAIHVPVSSAIVTDTFKQQILNLICA